MPTSSSKTRDLTEIMRSLHAKFNQNFDTALREKHPLLAKAEMKARAVSEVAEVLRASPNLTKTQSEILTIFDEVFADLVTSIYLASLALDKPARMLLRRALELGVAIVYLWDMPHLYWMWKTHDTDLSFKTMLEHIADPKYKSFLTADNASYGDDDAIDAGQANSVYRQLSNVIHGKLKEFESTTPDRFVHTPMDWDSHLALACVIENLLLKLWKCRFHQLASSWATRFVQFES
jgi:hypothetical protein